MTHKSDANTGEDLSYAVKAMDGADKGTVTLAGGVFNAPIKKGAVHETVRWQLACRRAGTHASKGRSEVSITGKKAFKQKGTGRARMGAGSSASRVGGAVAHGPKPRDYSYTLPKRVKKAALCSVLSAKAGEAKIVVLDSLVSSNGKTKEMAESFSKLGLNGSSSLIVISNDANDSSATVKRATRNITKVSTVPVMGVNVYDLLRHEYLVISKDVLSELEGRASGQTSSGTNEEQ